LGWLPEWRMLLGFPEIFKMDAIKNAAKKTKSKFNKAMGVCTPIWIHTYSLCGLPSHAPQ
jgi:hypothetical protein